MEGVEILNQTPVYSDTCITLGLLIPVIVCAIIGSIIALCYFKDGAGIFGALIGASVGLFIGWIATVIIGCTIYESENNIDHIEYQVTISDEVNLNDFMDKYEIVGQDGKIYTVIEKEK